jgi:hypothetical protein
MALDIEEINQIRIELVLKISDHMNRLFEIMEKRQNLYELNELFEQNFENFCEFDEKETNVEKSLDVSCKIRIKLFLKQKLKIKIMRITNYLKAICFKLII